MTYEPPLKITITAPTEIPRGFGPNATGKRGGNLRVRCTDNEYDLIHRESIKLGLTLGMYVRWCAVQVAHQLQSHRDLNSTSIQIGEEDDADN